MSKLSLTRYLYFLEEAKISFLECLLKKNSLKECYFWISEIYYSGFKSECWDLLIKIYYDFYYLSNTKMENKLKIKYKKKSQINTIFKFVTILYHSDSCPYLFIARTISKGRRKIKDIEKTIKLNLKTCQPSKVSFYIKLLLETDKDKCISILENFKGEKFKKHNYINNDFTLFQSLLAFSCKKYEQSNKNLYSKMSKSTLYYIDEMKKPCDKVYNTLKERRVCIISENIGCFKLGTNENKFDKKKSWSDKWEYLAKETPLWKERYNKYNASFDKQKLIFDDDDNLEKFYNLYNYESDELLLLFIKDTTYNTGESWLNSIYDTSFENLYKGPIDY